jgi:tetratricopeptide (TPR) repeat protein
VFEKLEGSEVVLIAVVSFFALTGVLGVRLMQQQGLQRVTPVTPFVGALGVEPSIPAAQWFQGVRQHCNPVEVETHVSWQPAPPTPEGDMHKAACYALAGRIDRARSVIEGLPSDQRYLAAGVVFEAGHPAADAGDDIAAGPLMELVVEYWPNHYMALYHAGAAAFERGEHAEAAPYLEEFLKQYSAEDGWRSNALSMLEHIGRD